MKTSARILASMGMGIACTALAACSGGEGDGTAAAGGSGGDSAAQQAFEARDAYMHELGDAIVVLNEMASEERPADDAAFLAAARTIADRAPDMLDHFENQTIVAGSRTKPEIFANWADFTAKHGAFVTAANALAEAASSGGFAAGRPLVAPLRDSCGGCHRPYRGPDPDQN
jgi:cytochrome c556